MNISLIYVHDPMCSWCWAFEKVRKNLFQAVQGSIETRRLLGGLAPDSAEPMSPEMEQMVQGAWKRIENTVPGMQFNFSFWSECIPRRSTYPANRAIIAARNQGEKWDLLMTQRIQQAYYREARNPSDNQVLIELANSIGLDILRFSKDVVSQETEATFKKELVETRKIGVSSFPSLVLDLGQRYFPIAINYHNVEKMKSQISGILDSKGFGKYLCHF